MGKGKFLLKEGSIVAIPATLSSLAAQDVNAVNWKYVSSFFPYFYYYMRSFFSEYYAKVIAVYSLSEKVRKIIEKKFPDCKWSFLSYEIGGRRGEWEEQYWHSDLGGELCTKFFVAGKKLEVKIVQEFCEGYPKLKFYNPFGGGFYIENEEDLKRVKNLVNSLKNSGPDIQKLEGLCSGYSGFFSWDYLDENGKRKFVVKWPKNFTPELEINGKKYKAKKLMYNILDSNVEVYSEDYESGEKPLVFDREEEDYSEDEDYESGEKPLVFDRGEIDNICKNILDGAKKFGGDLLKKAKTDIEKKFKEIKLEEYDKNKREIDGTFEIEGVKVPIRLRASYMVDVGFGCQLLCFPMNARAQGYITSFVSLNENEGIVDVDIEKFKKGFKYFLEKFKILKGSSRLVVKEENEDNDVINKYFDENRGEYVLCMSKEMHSYYIDAEGRKSRRVFCNLAYNPNTAEIYLYRNNIDRHKVEGYYDISNKDDRESFDKLFDDILKNKKVTFGSFSSLSASS